MRLKDILWPWGRIKQLERALDTAISGLERQSETIVLGITNQLTNIEYGARQRDIAANLRSECLRLHKEVARLNDVLGHVSTMAENNQTTKRLEVLYDIQTRTGLGMVRYE